MSEKAFVVELNDESEYQRLLPGQPKTRGMKSGRVYLQAGQDCGQHSTEDREEMLIFLAGQGKAIIDEQEDLEVGIGKVAYIPPHTIHNIQNTGSEPLIYIYCVAPVKN